MPTSFKALLYVLIAVAGSSVTVFTADGWTSGAARWNVAVVTVGAVGVWLKKNTPTQPWAKLLVGLFTAGAAVLVSAWTDRHIEPAELQQIVLAVLGAAAVGAADDGAQPADSPPLSALRSADELDAAGSDSGRTRVLMVVVLAVCALLVAAVPASAHRWEGRGPVIAPRVSSTAVCDGGTLVVGYDAVQLAGRQWVALMDDGTTTLELQETSGRSGPNGSWMPVRTASGGEHYLRWAGYGEAIAHGARYALARIVTGGYRSTGYPLESTCPAA